MRELLEQKLARFEQLEKELVDPEVLAKPAKLTAVVREHGSLARLVGKYRRFKQITGQIHEAQQ
ncbi:MAG: PCRF domain-containing protein, partial [Acidobacteriota bacterium]